MKTAPAAHRPRRDEAARLEPVEEPRSGAAEGLRPAVEALAIWGLLLLPPVPTGRARAATTAALARSEGRADGPLVLAGFTVGDERFWVRIGDGEATVRHGVPATEPDVVVSIGESAAFFALATRAARPADLPLEVTGDRAALRRLLKVWFMPSAQRATA